jgi:hypothetical protein
MSHWEKVFVVLGNDSQGRALLAGPVKTVKEARELAAEKIRTDAQWRRAFVVEAPLGFDFHLTPDAPGEKTTEAVRKKSFPNVPPMVGGPEKATGDGETEDETEEDEPAPRKRA